MTQEQKAKRYDEALNWMRELYPGLHGATKEDAEHFFPELAESEDERIRKALVEYFAPPVSFTTVRGISVQKVRDWLEKKEEQSEEPKIAFGDWGDKEKKEAIITCLKYMRFVKKITNEECKDLVRWFEDNLVANVLEKDGWTIASEQTDTIKEDYYGAFLRGEMRGYLRAKNEHWNFIH